MTKPNTSERLLALSGLSGRVVFAAVLAGYFWSSALTKFDGLGVSAGAFVQIFPRQMEAVGYDSAALPFYALPVVLAGSVAELVLPALLVAGLATRLSALAMIGFILVMTLTDIFGHGVTADTLGTWFDRFSDGVLDQRALWVGLLAGLVLSGGGYLSLDRWISRARVR
ncbi:DoxX family protein [Thioclava sp. GXIMD4215]|uniref:DoxX family protein n=1 Tax=Thioclava sp. GXIMD4215 TaxID=3131928 RepID=UPI00324A7DE9